MSGQKPATLQKPMTSQEPVTSRRRNSVSSVPVTSVPDNQTDRRTAPRINLPNVDPAEDELDLNNVQVIDDLNINRWLMRIMRLGANYVSSGSNGYKTSGKSSSGLGGGGLASMRPGLRRYSVCEAPSSSSSLLRPMMTSRGRRMSDCISLSAHHNPFKFQRRGGQSIFDRGFESRWTLSLDFALYQSTYSDALHTFYCIV